jgi:hypothetical protein
MSEGALRGMLDDSWQRLKSKKRGGGIVRDRMWIVKFIGTDSGVAEIEMRLGAAHGGCDEWAGGERQSRVRAETRQCPQGE